MSKKRGLLTKKQLKRAKRLIRFHRRMTKRNRGWHGRWSWEAHQELHWEAYVGKLRASGAMHPAPDWKESEECPF